MTYYELIVTDHLGKVILNGYGVSVAHLARVVEAWSSAWPTRSDHTYEVKIIPR